MDVANKRLLLAELTNNIVTELQQRISNIDNQINLAPEEARINLKGQKVALNESIRIVQDEFMKKIGDVK